MSPQRSQVSMRTKECPPGRLSYTTPTSEQVAHLPTESKGNQADEQETEMDPVKYKTVTCTDSEANMPGEEVHLNW